MGDPVCAAMPRSSGSGSREALMSVPTIWRGNFSDARPLGFRLHVEEAFVTPPW